jgi:N-acetylglucosaminyl-diphospho-decaprenol L-rhamnosyltransferase
MTPLDLSIIIVNWKSVEFTRKCLASIYPNTGHLLCEVIVVDNASFDGCDRMVKAEFPQVVFLQSDVNLGFAGANNLAFDRSCGRNILFLNPDTELQGSALQALVSALESLPEAGMVGALLLNPDLTMQTTCVTALPSILNQNLNANVLRSTFPKWRIWGMLPLYVRGDAPRIAEAISGACMGARRGVIEQVAGFTTDYFMYAEDMDLCTKIRKAGWEIYYVPEARIVHYGGGSSSHKETNFSSLVMRESVARYMKLHRGHSYALLYRLATALVSVCRILMLVAALPAAIRPGVYEVLSRALSKWSAILAWSVGAKRSIETPSNRQHPIRQAAKIDSGCAPVQP